MGPSQPSKAAQYYTRREPAFQRAEGRTEGPQLLVPGRLVLRCTAARRQPWGVSRLGTLVPPVQVLQGAAVLAGPPHPALPSLLAQTLPDPVTSQPLSRTEASALSPLPLHTPFTLAKQAPSGPIRASVPPEPAFSWSALWETPGYPAAPSWSPPGGHPHSFGLELLRVWGPAGDLGRLGQLLASRSSWGSEGGPELEEVMSCPWRSFLDRGSRSLACWKRSRPHTAPSGWGAPLSPRAGRRPGV